MGRNGLVGLTVLGAASLAACNMGSGSKSGGGPGASSTGSTTSSTVGTLSSSSRTTPTSASRSNFLYVADAGNDALTVFALDPTTGAPSNPADTPLIPASPVPGAAVFHVSALATDPTGSLLFAAGMTTAAIFPPTTNCALLPIELASGVLTPGTPSIGAVGSSVALTVDPVSNVVFTVDDYPASSIVTPGTSPMGGLSPFVYASGTGALTPETGTPVGTLGGPFAATINPAGTFLFAVDPADTLLAPFGIDSGGFVTGPSSPTFTVQASFRSPQCVAIGPNGVDLAAGNADGTIDLYSVAASGAITLNLPGIAVEPPGGPANASILGIAIDPTGSFIATANGPSGDVSLIQINNAAPTASGPLVGPPYAIPGSGLSPQPTSVVWNADGSVVYVANAGANSISALSIGVTASGTILTSTGLAALPGSPFALPAGDLQPMSLAVSR